MKQSHATQTRITQAINKISMVMKQEAWELKGPVGLNPAQGRVLELLSQETRAPRVGDIARMLGVTAASMTDSVKSLIEKGLVEKQKSIEDGRAYTLHLTSKGRTLLKRMGNTDEVLELALDALTEEELTVMHRGMMKMIYRLQQEGRINVARLCVTCQYFEPWAHDQGDTPHHCHLIKAPLAEATLQLDCPEHEAAPPATQSQHYRITVQGKPIS